ncbi:MAG: RadC family protein [Methylobacter sp.]
MSIKDWSAEDRPREKLLRRGSAALTDAELLAIFLRTGSPGKSAVDLARELLSDFGSLNALLSADQQRFCDGKGLGEATYAQLQAVLEMARRHFKEVLQRGNALTSPDITRSYLSAQLRGYSYEVFACLFLDNQHRVIQLDELFRGTIDGASVYPREVAKQALRHNAAAVIFLPYRFYAWLWTVREWLKTKHLEYVAECPRKRHFFCNFMALMSILCICSISFS